MSTLREQFSAARKAQVETQLDFVRNLTSNVVDSTGKLVALNLSTGRNSIEKSAETIRKLVTATSPRDLIDLSAQSKSGFDTLLNYGSELFNIASRAQAELLKSAAPAALAASAPAQALRALPTAKVEVEVQAEVAPAPVPVPEVHAEVQVQAADPDGVTAVPFTEVVQPEAQPVQAAAPAPAPEPQAEAAPVLEISEEVQVPGHTVKATPLAEAISEAVGAEPAPVLEASPLVTNEIVNDVTITGIEPVDAKPPHAPVSGNPVAQEKAESPAKGRRKK
jgi:phasin family protein